MPVHATFTAMRTLFILPALLLSGCTSYQALQSSNVDRVVQSTKTVADFSGCVSRVIGKAPIASEDGLPMIAVTNAYGSPLAVLTFKEIEGGSIAEVRQNGGLAQTGFVEDCS